MYEAFEAQRNFVNNASHELKTPLARISTMIERAVESGDDVAFKEILAKTANEVGLLTEVVESLLLIHRLQAGTPIASREVRIDELLYECMNELHATHEEVQFHFNMDESITEEAQLTLHSNALLLRICFMNLLKNAATYSTLPSIDIAVNSAHGALKVTVSNAGTDSLNTSKLFQPFYRDVTSRGTEGTGLGLCIVRQIAHVFKGEAHYFWKTETAMHCFSIDFPQGGKTETLGNN